MRISMSPVAVNKVFLDRGAPDAIGRFEFTVDCGAVYFGAVYNDDGTLMAVDQYFFTDDFSRDDLGGAEDEDEMLSVDERDFPVKTYLLTRQVRGSEWLRFHAVVPADIDSAYFGQKYIGE